MISYKKILFMFCLLFCAVFQIFANSKISLANKSLLISKVLENEENDDNYDEYDSEELYEEEYEDEDEEIEYYDKNGKRVIFVDSSYGKNKQSKTNKHQTSI